MKDRCRSFENNSTGEKRHKMETKKKLGKKDTPSPTPTPRFGYYRWIWVLDDVLFISLFQAIGRDLIYRWDRQKFEHR